MRARPLRILLLALVCAACGRAESETRAPDVAAAPPGSGAAFSIYGLPGPWSREGGTRGAFEADVAACRTQSTRAREGAADPHDAAYRAFLGCMSASGWRRGGGPAGAAGA